MKVRTAAVAGSFYAADKAILQKEIETIYKKELEHITALPDEINIIGGVVPHAGYMYSAYQAIHFFHILKKVTVPFETIVILHPNHRGYGSAIAIDENNAWETPLGLINLDEDFMQHLPFEKSAMAHQYEHSGEIMLPLLQHFLSYTFKIVPICMLHQNYENAVIIAKALLDAQQSTQRKIAIIASSDFSHFLTPARGKDLDDLILAEIENKNTKLIEEKVRKHNISVCGYGPIMALMEYSKMIDKNYKTKLLKYGHSGEVNFSDKVVDYASILFYK